MWFDIACCRWYHASCLLFHAGYVQFLDMDGIFGELIAMSCRTSCFNIA